MDSPRPPGHPRSPCRPYQPRLSRDLQCCAVPWKTAEDPATDPGPGGESGQGWSWAVGVPGVMGRIFMGAGLQLKAPC